MISNLPPPKEYANELYFKMLRIQNLDTHIRMSLAAKNSSIVSLTNTKKFIETQTQGFLDADLIQYLDKVHNEILKLAP